ncbi:MAG TPA: secretin N-terminal domain-containing protein [Sedimentisphaerales bacterium]|nr:secretin N-terminal domain-containing protein [Sedimentisphaerales bacterium]
MAVSGEQKTFALREITPQQAIGVLSELGLGVALISPDSDDIVVTGSAADLYRAGVVLDLVDTRDAYLIETLAPVSDARAVPTNGQIATALGNVVVGTFASPPQTGERGRAIIDIHGESVIAIIPARTQRELLAFVEFGAEGLRRARGEPEPAKAAETAVCEEAKTPPPVAEGNEPAEVISAAVLPNVPVASGTLDQPTPTATPSKIPEPSATTRVEVSPTGEGATAELASESVDERQETVGMIVPRTVAVPARVRNTYEPALPANAEDVLQLDLPDRLEVIQLLDLAAEYLSIDYMYEADKIRGQTVSLRLHGKLQGEIRVKDLYPLLESVLKFKGFAMTCHKGSLVTIVPTADALRVDPTLLGENETSLGTGDMVVTRVFDLQYVNAASAMNLLDSMKLSMAASPIEEAGTLIVTCYAYQMERIERLLEMVDRPGRPKEFRFRQLKYTMAGTLAQKVETLVAQLQTIPVKIAPMEQKASASAMTASSPSLSLPSSPRKTTTDPAASVDSTDRYTVYLDADERTNRILMIGQAEQLGIVEDVIDALDVAQHDPRTIKVYAVVNLGAADAKKKLEELEVIAKAKSTTAATPALSVSKASASSDKPGGAEGAGPAEMEETQVTVLETTNSLLINASQEQHARITAVLKHVDVVQQDLRSLKVYEIKHVDAEEVKKQLAEFDLVGAKSKPAATATPASGRITSASATPATADATGVEESANMQEPQVSVLESTNSLLINATPFQHARMAHLIEYVDTVARQEAIPYEIYFLENQDPEHLAEVLQKILQETIQDKDAKVEKVVRKIEDQIMIVPDKNTFSLIVYASKKNQDWISKLIKTLDKRRPQVLIDATLVEIRKNDEFNYDLNLVASIPDLTQTSGQTEPFMADDDTSVTDALLQSDRSQFVDFQVKSGEGIGFYGDKHIQALLTAVQKKDYGRVLAKPKVLVNDNEKGNIKTADTTYVATTSSVPVTGGTTGTQNNMIETSLQYQAYEAGITLEITPHISEGDLLRLEITLSRSDFTNTSADKPPDLTSSNVGTVVTVPDGSTIILGGMLKLNQSKGGSKVPILGDLPLIGGAFRSIDNSDVQSMLYIFVRAEIIRPADTLANGHEDLQRISDENREAFEQHEQEFQGYKSWPGRKAKPMSPDRVLDAR